MEGASIALASMFELQANHSAIPILRNFTLPSQSAPQKQCQLHPNHTDKLQYESVPGPKRNDNVRSMIGTNVVNPSPRLWQYRLRLRRHIVIRDIRQMRCNTQELLHFVCFYSLGLYMRRSLYDNMLCYHYCKATTLGSAANTTSLQAERALSCDDDVRQSWET
jgi:hypothetical protein